MLKSRLPNLGFSGIVGSAIGAGQINYIVALAGVFVAYAAAGTIGLAVPTVAGGLVPFWPAAAVSLTSVLLFGFEVWPAIFAADLALSLAHRDPFVPALG